MAKETNEDQNTPDVDGPAEHLGYGKGDPSGRGSGNNRSGVTAKTVRPDIGEVPVSVLRDRNGSVEPKDSAQAAAAP